MARKQETRLVDDIDGSDAVDSRTLYVGDRRYVIDLSAANLKRFDEDMEAIAKWADYATSDTEPVLNGGGRGRGRAKGAGGGEKTRNRDRNTEIRNWALSTGVDVAARGRISASVVELWEQAQQRGGEKAVAAASGGRRSKRSG